MKTRANSRIKENLKLTFFVLGVSLIWVFLASSSLAIFQGAPLALRPMPETYVEPASVATCAMANPNDCSAGSIEGSVFATGAQP